MFYWIISISLGDLEGIRLVSADISVRIYAETSDSIDRYYQFTFEDSNEYSLDKSGAGFYQYSYICYTNYSDTGSTNYIQYKDYFLIAASSGTLYFIARGYQYSNNYSNAYIAAGLSAGSITVSGYGDCTSSPTLNLDRTYYS